LKSYLLSVLAIRFGLPGKDLSQLHGEEWLVWEPGTWHAPPRSGATLVASPSTLQPPTAGEALVIPLDRKSEFVLGRDPGSQIAINDGTLSATHLVLSVLGNIWTIKDLASRNGTKLDGTRLMPKLALPLQSGARIQAGDVMITFYSPEGMRGRLASFLEQAKE
jgi:pSer/pThr/pTyr-binding forkhead associated (FHA) protein